MKTPAQTQNGVIAVCSRGLIHSRTAEALSHLQRVYRWHTLFTHDLPIPEAQNEITKRALALGCEWILYIEEDNVPPVDLIACATTENLVQCCDYALPGGQRSVALDASGRVLFCGMGCLFVAAEVFKKIKWPWFTDTEFLEERNAKHTRLKPGVGKKNYGGQDISLCFRLQQANIPVFNMRGVEAEHLRIKRMGDSLSNNGCHTIERL